MTTKKGSKNSRRTRATITDNTVVTAKDRQKSMIATSPASAKAYLDRSGTPLVLDADVKMIWQGLMSVNALMALQIDTRYQREEISSEVNMLIHVLNHKGQIPDPVTIAERPDGSRWIVDGQQRWWAHVDTAKPMQARVYAVKNYDQELTLFHVLNNSKKLTARTRLQSWPKAAGDAIRWMNEAEESPMRGLISFTTGHQPFPVVTVMRALATTVVGALGNGAIERICGGFDRESEKDKKWVDKATRMLSFVLASMFDNTTPLRHLTALAIGRLCHATWRPLSADDAWPSPTPKQLARFKRTDWERLAPGYAVRWLPVVTGAMLGIWNEATDPEEYARAKAKLEKKEKPTKVKVNQESAT